MKASLPSLRFGLVLLLWPSLAHAGGMFLPGRGVRPFARGGAFTAGADDLNALGYNPAGLADMLSEDQWGEGHQRALFDGEGGSRPPVYRWHLLLDVGVVAESVDTRAWIRAA